MGRGYEPMLWDSRLHLTACHVPRWPEKCWRSCVDRWASQTHRKCRNLPFSSSKGKVSPGKGAALPAWPTVSSTGVYILCWGSLVNSGMGPLCR